MKKLLFFVAFTFGMLGANSSVFAQNEEEWDGVARYGVNIVCQYPEGVEQVCQVGNNSNIQLNRWVCNSVDSVVIGDNSHANYMIYWQETTVDSIFVDGEMVWCRAEGMNYVIAEYTDHNYDIMYWSDNHISAMNVPGDGAISVGFHNCSGDHSIRVVHADIEYFPRVVEVDCIYEKTADDLYYNSDAEVPYEGDGSIFNVEGDAPLCGVVDSVIRNKNVRYYVDLAGNADLVSVAVDGLKVWTREGGLNYADARIADEENQQMIFASIDTATLVSDKLFIGFNARRAYLVTLEYAESGEPINPSSIANVDGSVVVAMNPNPATSSVMLSVAGIEGRTSYTLNDISGRQVMSGMLDDNGQTRIDISNLAKGTYFVSVIGSRKYLTEKLIVK